MLDHMINEGIVEVHFIVHFYVPTNIRIRSVNCLLTVLGLVGETLTLEAIAVALEYNKWNLSSDR